MPINIIRKLETELHVDKLSFLWSPYEKDLISHLNSFAKGKCAAVMPFDKDLLLLIIGLWRTPEIKLKGEKKSRKKDKLCKCDV